MPLRAFADPVRVRQVLFNLLSNAIKFTRSGWVVLHAQADRDRVVLEVEDSGPGIAAEHQKQLFQDFFQVDSSSTRHHEGSGLGLVISRKLLALMDGSITCRSRLGEGSTFTVHLPGMPISSHEPPPLLAGRNLFLQLDPSRSSQELAATLVSLGAALVEEPDRADWHLILRQFAPHEEKTRNRALVCLGAQGTGPLFPFPLAPRLRLVPWLLSSPTQRSEIAQVHTPAPHSAKPRQMALLVDDNPVNRRLAQYLLEQEGFVVHSAENGVEALAAVGRANYAIILMDCAMPVMDGYEATRQIRAQGVQTPIVAVTAHALPDDRSRCLSCGMNDFLSKPITRENLQRVLQNQVPATAMVKDP
jgi:CheY-like chemotaxis protein